MRGTCWVLMECGRANEGENCDGLVMEGVLCWCVPDGKRERQRESEMWSVEGTIKVFWCSRESKAMCESVGDGYVQDKINK